METVYVVVMMQNVTEKTLAYFSVEPVGVYSDLELALDHIEQLEDAIADSSDSIFDVIEFDIDETPILLAFLQREKELAEESLEKAIISLMKDGLVDQLIGEDGKFYYSLTELGEREAQKIPKHVKKFFKKGRG